MEARLSEVQKRLLLLLVVALAVLAVVIPRPGNRHYRDALDEVLSFRASFVQREAEAALRAQAQSQRQLSLDSLLGAANQKHGPKLKVSPALAAPRALSSLRLATLADAHRYAEPGASLTVGLPDGAALGNALAWRMARAPRAGTFTLTAIELLAADVSEEDAALEQRVNALRLASVEARAQLEEATRKVASAERRYEKRSKRRSRSLAKVAVALEGARDVLTQKSQASALAHERYESAARSAEGLHPTIAARLRSRAEPHASSAELPKFALARIDLEQGTERSRFSIPVRVEARSVSVPPLQGADFRALRAASLWDEVKDASADSAVQTIQNHFSWHYRTAQLLGYTLSGAHVLELAPCVLPFLLALLLVQMRRAETFYSPFSTKVPSSLPQVGFKNRLLELGALVFLPLIVAASASASLWSIDKLPVLPAIAGALCAALGGYAFSKLRDLRNQAISIVRSHSYPPPAHDLFPSP